MPVPTRMNPIWDMEEQASVRFRFRENTASTAPRVMVTRPTPSTHFPHKASWRNTFPVITRIPKTPVLVRIPESRAEAGAGAAG